MARWRWADHRGDGAGPAMVTAVAAYWTTGGGDRARTRTAVDDHGHATWRTYSYCRRQGGRDPGRTHGPPGRHPGLVAGRLISLAPSTRRLRLQAARWRPTLLVPSLTTTVTPRWCRPPGRSPAHSSVRCSTKVVRGAVNRLPGRLGNLQVGQVARPGRPGSRWLGRRREARGAHRPRQAVGLSGRVEPVVGTPATVVVMTRPAPVAPAALVVRRFAVDCNFLAAGLGWARLLPAGAGQRTTSRGAPGALDNGRPPLARRSRPGPALVVSPVSPSPWSGPRRMARWRTYSYCRRLAAFALVRLGRPLGAVVGDQVQGGRDPGRTHGPPGRHPGLVAGRLISLAPSTRRLRLQAARWRPTLLVPSLTTTVTPRWCRPPGRSPAHSRVRRSTPAVSP